MMVHRGCVGVADGNRCDVGGECDVGVVGIAGVLG